MNAESTGKQPLRTLDMVDNLWPAFRYLGMGIWLAWVLLLTEASSWISPETPLDVDAAGTQPIITFLIVFYAATATALGTIAALHRSAESFVESKVFIPVVGAIGMVGGTCTVLSGPYYLPAGLPVNLSWLFYAGGACCGVASALVFAKSAGMFGHLPQYRVLVYTVLANVMAGFVYFAVISLDFFRPRVGGPPLGGMVAVAALPLLAAIVLSVGSGSGARGKSRGAVAGDAASAGESRRQGSGTKPADAPAGLPGALPQALWRFAALMFVVSFAATAALGPFQLLQNPADIHSDATVVMFVRLVVLLALLLAVIRYVDDVSFDRILLFTIAIITVALCVFPVVSAGGRGIFVVVSSCVHLIDFCAWCLICFAVFANGWSGLQVNSIGRCASSTGSTLGMLAGALLVPTLEGSGARLAFYVVLAIVVVFCAVFVCGEKEYRALFGGSDTYGMGLDHLVERITEERAQLGSRKRRWSQACDAVSAKGALSSRESEIMEKLSLGKRPNAIAEELFISPNTVRVHVQNIYKKLDIHSQQELSALVKRAMDALELPERDAGEEETG